MKSLKLVDAAFVGLVGKGLRESYSCVTLDNEGEGGRWVCDC